MPPDLSSAPVAGVQRSRAVGRGEAAGRDARERRHAWVTFVLAGLVFSLANMVVKPIVAVLAIPLIIVTLGIAYFLVNVLMMFSTSWVVGDFHVDGFWWGVGAR